MLGESVAYAFPFSLFYFLTNFYVKSDHHSCGNNHAPPFLVQVFWRRHFKIYESIKQLIARLITFQCKIPVKKKSQIANSQIARYFEIDQFPNVNQALFVTDFETLSGYMRLIRNIMDFSGNFGKIDPRIHFDVFSNHPHLRSSDFEKTSKWIRGSIFPKFPSKLCNY